MGMMFPSPENGSQKISRSHYYGISRSWKNFTPGINNVQCFRAGIYSECGWIIEYDIQHWEFTKTNYKDTWPKSVKMVLNEVEESLAIFDFRTQFEFSQHFEFSSVIQFAIFGVGAAVERIRKSIIAVTRTCVYCSRHIVKNHPIWLRFVGLVVFRVDM